MKWNCQPKNVTKYGSSLVYLLKSRAIVSNAPANDWDNIEKVVLL